MDLDKVAKRVATVRTAGSQLTAGELIAKLQAMPVDATVTLSVGGQSAPLSFAKMDSPDSVVLGG